MGTNVSKKPAAYIFRVSEEAVQAKLDDRYGQQTTGMTTATRELGTCVIVG
jgi:hypothetical protein